MSNLPCCWHSILGTTMLWHPSQEMMHPPSIALPVTQLLSSAGSTECKEQHSSFSQPRSGSLQLIMPPLPAKLFHLTSAGINQQHLQGLVPSLCLPSLRNRSARSAGAGIPSLQEVRLTGQQHTSKGPHKDRHSGCVQTQNTGRGTKETLSR